MFNPIKKLIKKSPLFSKVKQKGSVEAYDIWAPAYDAQPDNLMLQMDELVFTELLSHLNVTGKHVADIGCGTGRHWSKLLKQSPASLTGFDVSAGMLNSLKQKFPDADTHQITDNFFFNIPSFKFDVIVSTLTVAHIANIKEALQAWSRMLKPAGDMIITDFHPNTLANGGKRTFKHDKGTISVQNFVHLIPDIEQTLLTHNLQVVKKIEKKIDASVKHFYAAQNALPVYEQFKGDGLIYGIHLKRYNGTQ